MSQVGTISFTISAVNSGTRVARDPAAFPKVGDTIVSYGHTIEVLGVYPKADDLYQVVYQNNLGTTASTSLAKWAHAVLHATEVRLAEDNQPVVPQEPECTCVSLLWGHETRCPLWRKI